MPDELAEMRHSIGFDAATAPQVKPRQLGWGAAA